MDAFDNKCAFKRCGVYSLKTQIVLMQCKISLKFIDLKCLIECRDLFVVYKRTVPVETNYSLKNMLGNPNFL